MMSGTAIEADERFEEHATPFIRTEIEHCLAGAPPADQVVLERLEQRARCGGVAVQQVDGRVQLEGLAGHGRAELGAAAARQAETLGLSPVIIRTVTVGTDGGPEAAARTARYAALNDVAAETGAHAVLLGHTLDDQADGYVIADVVKFEPEGALPESASWSPVLTTPASCTAAAAVEPG